MTTEHTENTKPEGETEIDVEKKIKDYCVEMSSSMLRSEAEGDFRKEATARLSELLRVDKGVLNFCARTYHRQDFDVKTQRMSDQQDFYVRIFGEPEGNQNNRDVEDDLEAD